MFQHDIFSPPDMGGPLGATGSGDLNPWEPQLVPEVSPSGNLAMPIAIPSVSITGGALNQPFTPTPLPLAQTSTTRVVAPVRAALPVLGRGAPVPLLNIAPARAGTARPLSLLPGQAPGGGILIPIPGQAPPDVAMPPKPASSLPTWVLPVALIGGGLLIGAYVLATSKKKATPNSRGWSRTEREAKGRRRRARRRHGKRRGRVLGALHNPRRRGLPAAPRRPTYLSYQPSRTGRYVVMRGGTEVMRGDAAAIRWAFGVFPPPAGYTLKPTRVLWRATRKAKPNKGKPRIVSGHPATRRCPHCGGKHSRSAHWSHMRGHHRQGPKGGSYYGHVR